MNLRRLIDYLYQKLLEYDDDQLKVLFWHRKSDIYFDLLEIDIDENDNDLVIEGKIQDGQCSLFSFQRWRSFEIHPPKKVGNYLIYDNENEPYIFEYVGTERQKEYLKNFWWTEINLPK